MNLFKKREKLSSIYSTHIVNSTPAEIAVIEMKPGPDQFNILYVNKTKSDSFNIDNIYSVIGKKCFNIFEPFRTNKDKFKDGHCENCPSLKAFANQQETIQADWMFFHPIYNQFRIVGITSKCIEGTTQVVEIVRDNTIRKRIFDAVLKLVNAKTENEISEIFFTCFLKEMYFHRCKYYRMDDYGRIYLKSFKKSIKNINKVDEIEIVDENIENFQNIATNIMNYNNSIVENTNSPRLFYIPEYLDTIFPNSSHIIKVSVNDKKKYPTLLDKKEYPIWIDIPLISSNKKIGMISLDITNDIKNLPIWNFDDYKIEMLGLFARYIAQSIENVRLLDIKELQKLYEFILESNNFKINEILFKILDIGTKFLGFEHGHIVLDNELDNITIFEVFNGNQTIRNLSFQKSIAGILIKNSKNIKYKEPIEYNFLIDEEAKKYLDVGDKDLGKSIVINSCVVYPIYDKDGCTIGCWYLESDMNGIFNSYMIDRIALISHQTSLAINYINQYQELQNKTILEVKNKEEALRNLKEKESFFQTAEHEMIGPIEPIMKTFSLIKKKLELLKINDEKLYTKIDDGINHCEFLSYTFENFEFLRTKDISLNPSELKLFGDVVIPIISILKEYAESEGKKIDYIGHQNVEKTMYLDISFMKNVFFNLIRNSVRYSEKGSIIYVKGVGVVDGISQINIENYGIGIPEGWGNKIFDLYTRAPNAMKYSPAGSGIGLYIVKKIILAHGGTIAVTSFNNPTIFTIKLPNNIRR